MEDQGQQCDGECTQAAARIDPRLSHHAVDGKAERQDGDVQSCSTDGGDEAERLNPLRWALDFEISRSRRYSAKLASHYARWERRSTMLTLLSGSSVIVSILAENALANALFAALVILASLCSIGLRWSEEALHYTKQYRAYTELAVRSARLGGAMTFDQYRQMKADYLQVESLEKSPLSVLNAICFKEECAYREESDGGIAIKWYQKLLANWMDVPPEPRKVDERVEVPPPPPPHPTG